MLSALLSFVVPLWALALLLKYKPQLVSSLAILSLSALVITSAVLQLSGHTNVELVVQTCLYAQLGTSLIYLAHRYKGYSLLLAAFLFLVTVLGLTAPFVRAIPTIIYPLLFLLFTLSTFPFILICKSSTIPITTQVVIPPLPSPAASSTTSFDKVSSYSIYKQPHTESGSTPIHVESPATGIRHRAQIIQTRSRNITLTLLISQLFTLLFNSLLLVLALVPHSKVIKAIQTLFMVFSICGFMFAFSLHGHTPRLSHQPNTPPNGRISISVSISKRQDQPNSDLSTNSTTVHKVADNAGDCPPHLHSWKDASLFSQPGGHAPLGLGLDLESSTSGRDDRVGRFKRFRKFLVVKRGGPSENVEKSAISLKNLHYLTTQDRRHTRFTSSSSSSSFSSPPHYNGQSCSYSHPRVLQARGVEEERAERREDADKFADVNADDGVELPVLSSYTRSNSTSALASLGQLPSPPDTPRARIRCSTTIPVPYTTSIPYHQGPNHVFSTGIVHHDENTQDNEEQVRIGIVAPAEKPNLTIRDIFVNAEEYEERGEIVDSAVSEPGHGNTRECFDFEQENEIQVQKSSTRVMVSSPSWSSNDNKSRDQTPMSTPTSTPVLMSPTFPNPSSWMMKTTNSFKRPMKSRSMMTLSLSFGSGSASGGTDTQSLRSPTLPWKRAERFKEKLKRPLTLPHSPILGYRTRKEEGLDFVLEEEESESEKGKRQHQHKKKGYGWSSVERKSPTFIFSSGAPTAITTRSTSGSTGSEWEWYPFQRSSSSLSKSKTHGDILGASISSKKKKKKREQAATSLSGGGRASLSEHQGQPMSDTADFVDLTDPFASPTPGFALPKWVGNNGSSVTAGSSASVGMGGGLDAGGSMSDVGHYGGYYSPSGGGASSSWCQDGGEDVYVNEEKETKAYRRTTPTMMWKTPKTTIRKSKSSAQWGKLPPVPPLPPLSSAQGYRHEHHNHDGLKKKQEKIQSTTMMKRTRASKRRPDSPMPTGMLLSGTRGRGFKRVVDEAEDEDEDQVLERPGSPVPPSPSSLPLTLTTAMELGLEEDTGVSVDVLGSGRIQRTKTNITTLNTNGSCLTRKYNDSGVKSRRGRNGSPVPIPFRRSHRRVATNVSIAGVVEEENEVVDGLDLEEVLLTQRLLRRLNSAEGMNEI